MEEKVTRILVVDDEEDLCEILKFNLETEGYEVDVANSGEEALDMDIANCHLILLDVMMGGMSGFAVARELRENSATKHVPIIFLTAKGTENDKITGFNIGADDYISKPFSIREVILRIRAVLRRMESKPIAEEVSHHTLTYKGLVVDTDRKTVRVNGEDIELTKTEYGILCTLLEHRGRVFSRHDLIRRIWPMDVIVSDRTVDVNITRVRKKLGPYADNLATRLGFGYYFDE
ncbi:MAG: response regulator transcription factor [Prevotella sp.]|uniref:response regulator transcription factor n=1 Tax=Prevotella sp. TaxID=59823 RepID=UPI002A2D932A|nr:response regulator transcription factor [Prevotella sp.]MDD7318994.1 response regulator transcription factor [Prevotellaceae bacterium]MDY4020774.1 response regulator transcription factor [Prevotella sp.]